MPSLTRLRGSRVSWEDQKGTQVGNCTNEMWPGTGQHWGAEIGGWGGQEGWREGPEQDLEGRRGRGGFCRVAALSGFRGREPG